jgi:hypothetical protein
MIFSEFKMRSETMKLNSKLFIRIKNVYMFLSAAAIAVLKIKI